MTKMCGNSICRPLLIIFNDCLYEGKFPPDWKKAYVVPVSKKGDKQCLNNVRPKKFHPGRILTQGFLKALF